MKQFYWEMCERIYWGKLINNCWNGSNANQNLFHSIDEINLANLGVERLRLHDFQIEITAFPMAMLKKNKNKCI